MLTEVASMHMGAAHVRIHLSTDRPHLIEQALRTVQRAAGRALEYMEQEGLVK